MRGYVLDIDEGTHSPVLAFGKNKISDNIRNALLTPKGTRPNLPRFGSRLHLLQFEIIDQTTLDLIHFCVQEAIRDSVDDILIESIEYDISSHHRSVTVSVVFSDMSNGLAGRSQVVFAKGDFS